MSDAPVLLVREPWDAGRLRSELLRSHPHEPVTVRIYIDGTDHEFPVTSVRRWVNAGAGTVTTLTVGDEMVPLTLARPQTLAEYDRTHDNGCSICRNPNCDNPGGKH